jgi:hypothetical protein
LAVAAWVAAVWDPPSSSEPHAATPQTSSAVATHANHRLVFISSSS